MVRNGWLSGVVSDLRASTAIHSSFRRRLHRRIRSESLLRVSSRGNRSEWGLSIEQPSPPKKHGLSFSLVGGHVVVATELPPFERDHGRGESLRLPGLTYFYIRSTRVTFPSYLHISGERAEATVCRMFREQFSPYHRQGVLHAACDWVRAFVGRKTDLSHGQPCWRCYRTES